MKREPLLNEKFSDECIANYVSEIDENKLQLETRPSDIQRWDLVYDFLFDTQFNYAVYKYSAGDPISEIVTLIEEATENFITYRNHPTAKNTSMQDSFLVYEECISLLSVNILIKAKTEVMGRLAQAFDLLGKDALIDKMLSHSLPDRKISTKLACPKPYEQLFAVFDAQDDARPKILEDYLKDWYKGMRKASWYGTDKNKQNPCAFYGYWSFESAAVTCLLKIDDSSYRDKLFYPKDFTDFARD